MDPLHWRNMFYFSQLKTVTPCDSQLALRKQGEEIFTALSRYVPPTGTQNREFPVFFAPNDPPEKFLISARLGRLAPDKAV